MKYFRNHNLQRNFPSTGQLNNLPQVTDSSYFIAIVEVVNHTSIKKVKFGGGYGTPFNQSKAVKAYIVDRDEFMHLRNVIVFESARR